MIDLEAEIKKVLPGCELQWQSLGGLSLNGLGKSIELQLLAPNTTFLRLDAQQVGEYWQQLPYWAFAWAAGQALAKHILLHPELVAGKRILDFGCGSGIVGIAAAKSGAESVLCCDSDELALLACQHNADRNGVDVSVAPAWNGAMGDLDCLLAADILYDLTSAGDLAQQCAVIPSWLVAETEYQLPPWSKLNRVAAYKATTLPVLEDFDQDLSVSIYHA